MSRIPEVPAPRIGVCRAHAGEDAANLRIHHVQDDADRAGDVSTRDFTADAKPGGCGRDGAAYPEGIFKHPRFTRVIR
jgi:hypothetical protein